MENLNAKDIVYNRMKRQGLLNPILMMDNQDEYIALFRLLQPVAPVHFTRPGDPPKLVHRTCFNDVDLSHKLREKHQIIKGRFSGGRVGYVFHEDLERYATAFRKPIHEAIMDLIKVSGGISKDQLKEELNYPSGEISKALTTLQDAFLVYEDQIDTDWDTGWFDFATEWFELDTEPSESIKSVSTVLLN